MILLRQAARSVWRGKRSYLACVVLMAMGIMVFVAFNLLYKNLLGAMNGLYLQQSFGDVFAAVGGIPRSAADRIGEIDGVAKLDATLVSDARVQLPDVNRIITLRISSFAAEEEDRLNGFLLVEGSEPGEDGILVGENFAKLHGLEIGDALPLILAGKSVSPIITGLVQSPEYVYVIPDTAQLMPDEEAFGYGYMTAARLGTLTGMTGLATNLSFLLEEGAVFSALEPQLEESLAPYGMKSLVERKNQPSHNMLNQEIESLGAMAQSLPSVFILMAVIILYIMLKRMIEQERSQIGTLKAFGFSDRTILLHYMCYGGITGLAGGVAGVALGLAVTDSFTGIYLDYFHLPAIRTAPDPFYLISGLLIAFGSGLLGAFMGTRGVLRLSPSDAMRPPSPPEPRGDLAGRLPFLKRILSTYGFMALRNITRNPFRSAFVVLGMAFSFAITAFMSSYGEMFDILLLNQFSKVELYDTKISLKTPTAYRDALEAGTALEGVHRVEGLLEVPVELRREHLKKNLSLTAIEEDAALYRIYDDDGDFSVPPPKGGVIISNRLAEDLTVKRGDTLTMRTPYTGDEDIPLPVLGVVSSSLGSTAYISMESLWELLRIPPAVTALLLEADDPLVIKDALLEAENVVAITDQDEAKQLYVDLLDTYGSMIAMMQLAGAIIAFAIITNTATISLGERSREYATMRVLGMHPGEIGQVVSFEYWVLAILACPPGVALTRWIKESMGSMIDNDIFSMPVYTAPSSYLSAALLCGAAVALSNWSARRKIGRLDMVGVLKERE